jgi:hypothetical protein
MATTALTRKLRKELPSLYLKDLPIEVSTSLPWEILEGLASGLTALPSSISDSLSRICSERDITGYFGLQNLSNPQLYDSVDSFYAVNSVLSFLKKFPFGKVASLDPLKKAEERFFEAEKLCRITNRRLRYYKRFPYRLKNRWNGLHSILHTARLLIRDTLGPLDLNEIHDHMRHGPGGAIGVTGDKTTAYYKYAASQYTCSTRALPYAEAAIMADPLWRRFVVTGKLIGDAIPPADLSSREAIKARLKVTDYNKVTFVEKTAQTHRAIAIEPLMNIYLQLGVGDLITKKLRYLGTNLLSQARNRSLAFLGSSTWLTNFDGPATLDLSMASDTLSQELVKELLPEDWYDLLDSIRSKDGIYLGSRTRWAKFSSMGNGFTFQLESMIFKALIVSVAKHYQYTVSNFSVYGDDIIVPKGLALRVIDVLAFCGFRINIDKSFIFGPFRESCGADFFEGTPVRPFYLKRQIKNAKDLLFVHNSFYSSENHRRFFAQMGQAASKRFRSVNFLDIILSRLHNDVRNNLVGPITSDLEGHIFKPWDLSQKSRLVLWDRDIQSWSYASMKAVTKIYSGDDSPLYLQLMGTHGSGRGASNEDRCYNPSLYAAYLLALEERGVSNSAFASAVTRRNSTRFRLATQTSTGWRND